MKRKSGILLPIFSLPSKYGIGALSKEAYEFVDFLKKAGQSYWQILPLGPTGYGDSPYQSFSTFAGNPYFIDLEELIQDGYLTKEECKAPVWSGHPCYVDYDKIFDARFVLLRKAYERSKANPPADMELFLQENALWVEDYALFMALKDGFEGKAWNEWPEDIKLRKPKALAKYRKQYEDDIRYYIFQQYYFAKQWKALKEYANQKGISIVGDIPIYVAFDSADTWANPELFQLDDLCTPIAVAGCPPDFFSATGQLWGNPLYRWDYHKKTGYDWWMRRMAHCFGLYDVVRIDHFRGFDEYYSIPYGDPTAEFGHWEKGPGYELFDVMKKKLGKKEVIAEDLGFLTPSVLKLVAKTGYPGMKIIEFAFDDDEQNAYLPHNYKQNCIVYTGTHDNDTVLGWFSSLGRKSRAFAKRYVGIRGRKEVNWQFIRLAMASVADTCIIPMQDYLGLGKEARINTPSTLGTNWKWRMAEGALTDELAARIYDMTKTYARL